MSKLGYIQSSYGKEFKISVANTYSYNILSSSNLPSNTVIVASNIDEDGNDTGTYSMIITDSIGTPVRLTYTISEGNGLHYSSDSDSLELKIDNDTIIEENGTLKFNINNHLSDYFSVDENGNITLNKSKIPNSSKSEYGISSIDGRTIGVDDNKIYINTANLQYSDNSTYQYGIVIGDGNSINIENGNLSLDTSSFRKSDENHYGFVKGDNETVDIEEGIVSVNTENLSKGTKDDFGISKPDLNTIIFNSYNSITVNESSLSISTPSSYGVSKLDSNTIKLNNDKISVKDYEYFKSSLSKYQKEYNTYKDKIEELRDYSSKGNVLIKDKDIQLFSLNESSVVEIDKPKYDEEVIYMPLQHVSVKFDIISTCDFILTTSFEEGTNETPAVDLEEINYDETIYSKEESMNPATVYKSTGGEVKTIRAQFSAKNFRNSTKGESLITTINFIVSSVEDHNKQKSEKFSIVRYNSLYKEEEIEEDTTSTSKEYNFVVTDIEWMANE